MLIEINSDSDFMLVARTFYTNGQGNSEKELEKDLKTIDNLRIQFNKYLKGGNYNLKLMLNHFIVINNTFGIAAIQMIKARCNTNLHGQINSLAAIVGIQGRTDINESLYTDILSEIK